MKFIRLTVLLIVLFVLTFSVDWRQQSANAKSWMDVLAAWPSGATLEVQEPSEPEAPAVGVEEGTPSLIESVTQRLASEQAYLSQHACLRAIVEPPKETPSDVSVYKWKDAEGRLHYSDRKPRHLSSTDIGSAIERKQSKFSLHYTPVGVGAPVGLRDQLRYSTDKIFELLSEGLSIENTRPIELNIRIYGQEKEYRALSRSLYPNSSITAPGFYSLKENLAVVLNRRNPEQTTRTAIHEAAHVVIAGLYGGTPRWFTEGFAEYVEPIHVRGQLASVKSNDYWFGVLRTVARSEGLPDLANYWSIPSAHWESELKNRYYAIAWSVIAFMMDDAGRRKNLSAFMGEMERKYCTPFAPSRLDSFYPGGIETLQRDWAQWVMESKGFTHRF